MLTADDGHRTQFELMAPRLRELGWPSTLFVYPSAISNADYAMTWPQLRELADTGVRVQSHTYWHPHLLRERRRMDGPAFRRFAVNQLERSRDVLQQRLGHPVSLLAWPFGISDAGLHELAGECGYRGAFGLGNRNAAADDPLFDMPRQLIVDAVDERAFEARLTTAFAGSPRGGP